MSDVTRSGQAQSAVAASYAERHRRAQPNGWWGAALLVATEAALFGSLLASYFFLRFQATTWPPSGIEPPAVALPLSLTTLLVASAVPMLFAVRAARQGRARGAWLLICVAMVAQCLYLAAQILSFSDDLNAFSPKDSAYGAIYFTMLAIHHAHVLIGILLSGWLLARLASGLTNHRVVALKVVTLYWYFVAAVGVLVVLTQISPSL